jgi:hypothetical protein
MVQHLSKEASSVGASREAKKIDIVSRRVVSHQELCELVPLRVHDFLEGVEAAIREN